MILALLLTRRDEAALRCIKSYEIHSEAAIVQVALRRLIRIWDATPEYAPPGVATREDLAAELKREILRRSRHPPGANDSAEIPTIHATCDRESARKELVRRRLLVCPRETVGRSPARLVDLEPGSQKHYVDAIASKILRSEIRRPGRLSWRDVR